MPDEYSLLQKSSALAIRKLEAPQESGHTESRGLADWWLWSIALPNILDHLPRKVLGVYILFTEGIQPHLFHFPGERPKHL